MLRQYLLRHPDVNVDLRERLSVEIVRAVTEGQVDIGIVAGTVRTENLQNHSLPARPPGAGGTQRPPVGTVAKRWRLWKRWTSRTWACMRTAPSTLFLRQVCDGLHRRLNLRIQVSNFEAACRMVEADVGVGILPQSSASRHAQSMAIAIVPLTDEWALREMQICVRQLDALPAFAQDLLDLMVADAKAGSGASG